VRKEGEKSEKVKRRKRAKNVKKVKRVENQLCWSRLTGMESWASTLL
jgi:hypothetical protein